MRNNFSAALDDEIAQLERQLSALRAARAALSTASAGGVRAAGRRASGAAGRKPGQRNFTAAQRAEQSRKMKVYWAKRRREQKAG
jgi:hypothetical protein